jgi:hypothetical protein
MSFKAKTIQELIRIVDAGAGLRMQIGNKSTDDLVRLAAAARKSGAVLFLTGLSSRDIADIMRIAEAGKGALVLEDNPTIPFTADGHQKG